ncbi:hypothetical protein LINGRAHAP2_LOCUS29837 [Linum grandiflorum]
MEKPSTTEITPMTGDDIVEVEEKEEEEGKSSWWRTLFSCLKCRRKQSQQPPQDDDQTKSDGTRSISQVLFRLYGELFTNCPLASYTAKRKLLRGKQEVITDEVIEDEVKKERFKAKPRLFMNATTKN